MSAGLNSRGVIWKFTYADDSQGGAVPSGSILYNNVYARISTKRSTQALLEQGLEVPRIFDVIFEPGYMQLQTNYVYEDLLPASPYYTKKFVIIGVHPPSLNDVGRKYIAGTLRRFDIAHPNDLQ